MPTLRPLTEVVRYDNRFVADAVVPALRALGFEGTVALAPDDADVVITGTVADLDALFAGKQKTELSALDKLKAAKRTNHATLVIRGRASMLRALVRALSPRASAVKGASKEIGAEASAPIKKKRDRVRTISGRYIKGARAGASTSSASTMAPALPAGAIGAEARAPADRTGFALQNLMAFVDAGLQRAGDVDDNALLAVLPGEVRRE